MSGWGVARAACRVKAMARAGEGVDTEALEALEEIAAAKAAEEEELQELREEVERERSRAEQEELLAKLHAEGGGEALDSGLSYTEAYAREMGEQLQLLEALRSEAEELREENAALQGRLHLTAESAQLCNNSMSSVKEASKQLRMTKARFVATYKEIFKTAFSVRDASEAVTRDFNAQAEELRITSEELNTVSAALQTSQAECAGLAERMGVLEGNLQQAKSREEDLQVAVEKSKQMNSKMRFEVEALREEREVLAAQCDTLVQQNFAVQKEKKKLDETNQALTTSNGKLAAEVEEARCDYARLQGDIALMESQHEAAMEKAAADHDKKTGRLRNRVANLEKGLAEMEEKLADAERIAEERQKMALQLLKGSKVGNALSNTLGRLKSKPSRPPEVGPGVARRPPSSYEVPDVVQRIYDRHDKAGRTWERRRGDYVATREGLLCQMEEITATSPHAAGAVSGGSGALVAVGPGGSGGPGVVALRRVERPFSAQGGCGGGGGLGSPSASLMSPRGDALLYTDVVLRPRVLVQPHVAHHISR